jgi:hypothetical protein
MITVGAVNRLLAAHPPLDLPSGLVGLLADNVEIVFEDPDGQWWTLYAELTQDEHGSPILLVDKDGRRAAAVYPRPDRSMDAPAALRRVDLGATPDTDVHVVSGASTHADA